MFRILKLLAAAALTVGVLAMSAAAAGNRAGRLNRSSIVWPNHFR